MEKVALEFWSFLLSFGRSSSVGGGVRKLGLGVAGTGGVISTDSLDYGVSAGVCGML